VLPDRETLRACRKIYDHPIDTSGYNYLGPGVGKGNSVWACERQTSDCSDFPWQRPKDSDSEVDGTKVRSL
jgi:hypothetical protein